MSGIYGGAAATGTGMKARLSFYEDLTTLPVVNGIENVVRSIILKRGTLDEVRDQVMSGEIEGGLLPTGDALAIPNMEVIPGAAVSAVGASRIYFLVSKRMLPTEIQRIKIDMNDLGAERFAAMMLAKKLTIRPEFVRSEKPLDASHYNLKSDDDGVDAYILTGRNSLLVRKSDFPFSLDLTQAWFEMTKLPFVINCWVVRRGCKLGTGEKELADAARRNDSDSNLASKTADKLKISESGVSQIYQKALTSGFDAPTVQSLRQFAKLMNSERIAPVPPVRIYQAPVQTRRV